MPAVSLWIQFQKAANLSTRTIRDRAQTLRALEKYTGKSCLEVTQLELVAYMARDVAPATRSTYATIFRVFYRWAEQQGLIEKSPMEGAPVPRRPKYAPRPVENIQLSRVLAACSRRSTRAMVLLAALAGLRVHEIAKIRGDDVDLERRTITVVGKGNKRAVIPLHPVLVDLAQQMPDVGYWFTPWDRPDEPINAKSCGQAISRAMRRAGVDATAHQLRHWYGTSLLESGADLRTVQELMRHESLATTQIYTRVTSERRRAAIDGLTLPGLELAA